MMQKHGKINWYHRQKNHDNGSFIIVIDGTIKKCLSLKRYLTYTIQLTKFRKSQIKLNIK